jgi:hypothetical protein
MCLSDVFLALLELFFFSGQTSFMNRNLEIPRVAIIGAGISSAACAFILKSSGIAVDIFEKSRGVGGRLSNRRVDWRDEKLQFDHGAQFFTAKDLDFASYLRRAENEGNVDRWNYSSPETSPKALPEDSKDRWIGVPTMSAAVLSLISKPAVFLESRVLSITEQSGDWFLNLEAEKGQRGPYSAVVSSAPAPQSLEILASQSSLFKELEKIEYDPCWCVMAAFEDPLFCEDLFESHEGPVSWAARDASKKNRPKAIDTWVVHGSGLWSEKHFEKEKDWVETQLLDVFFQLIGVRAQKPVHLSSHRWRYAKVSKALEKDFLVDETGRLFVIGDVCLGPRVEYAFKSGVSCARSLLKSNLLFQRS